MSSSYMHEPKVQSPGDVRMHERAKASSSLCRRHRASAITDAGGGNAEQHIHVFLL
jgi:hypothetical protein